MQSDRIAMPKVKPPADDQNKKLLLWTADRVKQCQEQNFYGKMTVHFENGRVTRTTTEKSEVPNV